MAAHYLIHYLFQFQSQYLLDWVMEIGLPKQCPSEQTNFPLSNFAAQLLYEGYESIRISRKFQQKKRSDFFFKKINSAIFTTTFSL